MRLLKIIPLFQWCHMSDVFQTLDTSNIDTYRLGNLVESFNLSKELIT